MRKKIIKISVCLSVVALATIGIKIVNNNEISSIGILLANTEALASGEGDYSQKIWERFYRPDGTGYNCAKPGNETCTGR